MTEKLKFPIEIEGAKACPTCGSEERIMDQLITRLREEGILQKDSFSEGIAFQVNLFDPRKATVLTTPIVNIPVVLVFYDICAKCKTIYCTRVKMIEMSAQMQMLPQKPLSGLWASGAQSRQTESKLAGMEFER